MTYVIKQLPVHGRATGDWPYHRANIHAVAGSRMR